MRRLLIVSPHFPPVNAPDMQRIRVSLPYFLEAGWAVTVLTADDPTPTAPTETELLQSLPAGVEVVRVRCLSRRWTRWFGIGNTALRALPFLFLAGCRLLGRKRHDVVYFSTTMFIVLPLGRLWRRLYGVPYVIDLQDPWYTDFYTRPDAPRPPGGWKYWAGRRLSRWLEGWTMRRVAHLVAVSPDYLPDLQRRHRGLDRLRCTVVPFGSPDRDLQWVRSRMSSRPAVLPPGPFRLVFAGALGPGMMEPVEVLFSALARCEAPVTVHFFGTSYSPGPDAAPATLSLAARHGVQDRVTERPARLPFYSALQASLEAEANLLFGSSELSFTPSKMLLLLATGRPLLALAREGSALARRLEELGQRCITFPLTGPDEATVEAVAQALRELARSAGSPGSAAPLAAYSAQALSLRQLEVLEAIARGTTNGK